MTRDRGKTQLVNMQHLLVSFLDYFVLLTLHVRFHCLYCHPAKWENFLHKTHQASYGLPCTDKTLLPISEHFYDF